MKITTVSLIVMLALVMTTASAAAGNEILFVLGTDVNINALQHAASNDTIAKFEFFEFPGHLHRITARDHGCAVGGEYNKCKK